ncbi:hypothetical protein [Erythrobacter sp. A6_0]|uniref:hypothetical protein n=1 Tax=Erythrobacter sp. A6_0 TaxID=2821089 RepID=UPI001ADB2F39|nr:hypothetical protein [Erythrobacter sp. A6_0]MBO9510602.1 hypothetical protein [Erythrobacter sp. A6_0]
MNDDFGERDIPLAVKYETSAIWGDVQKLLGVKRTGAAIAVGLVEAYPLGRWVSYSRSRNYYDNRVNHPLLTYRRVVGAVDAFEAGGWIEHFRQRKGARGKQSAMIALPKLIDAMAELLCAHPNLPLELPRPGVQLRDPDSRPLLLPSTREVARMGGKVLALNEAIVSVDARDPDGNALTAPVSRIFNTTMHRGGRFYAHGASWQNVKRDVRKRITLDGEPVVELDFATLHPAMLYAEVGAPMPRDCYAHADWPRPLVKRAMLILLNASSLPAARLAIAHCSEMESLPGVESSPIARAARLISDIKEMHQPVARFFHTDAGARLMKQESDMAEHIMTELLRQNVVALPVHDSFLVPASKKAALEQAMMRVAYQFGLNEIRIGDEMAQIGEG